MTKSNMRAQRNLRSLLFWDERPTNPLDSCNSGGQWRQPTVADGAGLKAEGTRKEKLDDSLPPPGFKVHPPPPPPPACPSALSNRHSVITHTYLSAQCGDGAANALLHLLCSRRVPTRSNTADKV